MTSARTAQSDRIHRECTCPPYVVRCAHPPDGPIVILGDSLAWIHGEHLGPFRHRFAVGIVEEYFTLACDCGVEIRGWHSPPSIPREEYHDYAAALAAFHEAEARLLAGGAE